MRVIKITRTIPTIKKVTSSTTSRRSIRQFAREFFATENHVEFAIEAVIFGVLLAISAWPIAAAAAAVNEFLQRAI